MALIIKNAQIFTFDSENTVFENGFIEIEKGIIKNIGDMLEFKDEGISPSEEILDMDGKIVMPGLICTHTHIYSAFARGMGLKGANPSNFLEILEDLWWRLDKKLNGEDIYYSALVTLIESIKNGVTTLFDHHASPNHIDGSLDIIEKAFRELGVRGTLCYEVSDRDGEEAALKGIRENSRFISKTQDDSEDMVKGLFGLHASFTLSHSTLERASAEAKALNAGFHIHVAEGVQDLNYNLKCFDKTVVQRLKDYSIINDKTILAHCIHIKEEEKELLKEGIVVHNPESNMNNAVGYCDVLDLLNKGILVGLGSDGFSANPFRAMDVCYVLHKHEKGDPRVMTPNDVINMAVINNGKIASKYFNNKVGVIEKNAKADIIALDYLSPTTLNKDNICGHIIFGMNSNLITHSIINGKVIMKDRTLIGINEKEVFNKSREVAEKLWERF